jgi:hypothetical protein
MTAAIRGEYPRPHFDRSHSWESLNGAWDFAPDPAATGAERGLPSDIAAWPATIVVPFAWETPASGVAAHWLPCGWYRRNIRVPEAWRGQRVVLHFGAVHHFATVWVNGTEVGRHEGGYTPFEFDVTDALGTEGDVRTGTVVVRVDAPLDKRFIVHGKQRSVPRDDYDGCSFTPSSGIWQSVWLEARPATYLRHVALRAAESLDAIVAEIELAGPSVRGAMVRVQIGGTGKPVELTVDGPVQKIVLPVENPRLWQPSDPHLYNVDIELRSNDGVDLATTSTGLRSVRVEGNEILLNGERLYVRGVLDQGYWPHTGITAPTDDAFVTDLELARAAGYNVVRKHLKLEDPRFFHHADRLGMLVWAEPASTGRFTPEAVARFEAQIEPMVKRDGNHPSIVLWGLYNEEWGLDWDVPGDKAKQDAVRNAVRLLRSLDHTRPLVDNSGWTHVDTDLVDWHIYDERPAGWSAKVASLLSGQTDRFPVSIAVDKVVDKMLMADGGQPPADVPNLNSEYGGGYTSVERGWNLRWQTQELRRYDALSGYVWTELYDIEQEMAGIYGFDRSSKDLGGNSPGLSNAETVVIVNVEPQEPGRDLVVHGRDLEISVQISHHGVRSRHLRIEPVWGPLLGELDVEHAHRTPTAAAAVEVKPFIVSEQLRVATRLPENTNSARLHLLAVENDTVVAASYLDVALGETGER